MLKEKISLILDMESFQTLIMQCKTNQLDKNEVYLTVKETCMKDSTIKKIIDGIPESKRDKLFGSLSGCLKAYFPQVEPIIRTDIDIQCLPSPLFSILELYHGEINSFRKVHRLIDLFEWAIKWHTVIVISDLLRSPDVSDEMKLLLATGLQVPSLGTWLRFFRDALDALENPCYPYRDWECLLELDNKHHIVRFRNKYAHGATPPDEDCQKDCEEMFPIFERLVASKMFSELQIAFALDEEVYCFVGDEKIPTNLQVEARKVIVVHKDNPNHKLFDLWPFALISEDPEKPKFSKQFFYFNAIKNKSIEQLNYEYCLHFRERSLWEAFHEYLPLDEWKKVNVVNFGFRERIEVLTEVFKGRRDEKRKLREFCLNGQGIMMVLGDPGIGKSSLLAQVFKEMRVGVDADGYELSDSVSELNLLPYFIKGTELTSPEHFLRHVCKHLDTLYDLKVFDFGSTIAELYHSMVSRLEHISKQEDPKRLIIFVDGLDEAVEVGTFLRCIPTSNKWMSVLCASRRSPLVTTWVGKFETSKIHEVKPLTASDIRALLYDVVSKYDDDLSQDYINELEKVSQGNPMYLKLLCDQVLSGEQTVGNIKQLPKHFEDLYEDILKRITDSGCNENVQRLLYLLTESKTAVSSSIVADILDINEREASSALDICMELLVEDSDKTGFPRYQLFHESLREHLNQREKKLKQDISIKLADFCFDWTKLEGESLQYALAYATKHLVNIGDSERLWVLLRDEKYRQLQIQSTSQYDLYDLSYSSLRDGLEWYVKLSGESNNVEMDARLSWLMLKCGDLVKEATDTLDIVFEWFREDPQSLHQVWRRLEVLDEQDF